MIRRELPTCPVCGKKRACVLVRTSGAHKQKRTGYVRCFFCQFRTEEVEAFPGETWPSFRKRLWSEFQPCEESLVNDH